MKAMTLRGLSAFVVSLVLVSWAYQWLVFRAVGDPRSSEVAPWLVGLMFLPSLWTIAYLAFAGRDAWKVIRPGIGRISGLFAGALLPAAFAFVTLAVVLNAGWGESSHLAFASAGVDVARGPWILGSGPQNWPLFVANVAATSLAFAMVNGVAAVGEEFCWRGFLQHHFIERFGPGVGVVALGFVWAMWHLPVSLAGYNYAQAPVLGALVLFPIELIAVSFIMAWLTIRSGSLWPAVLMHGAGNGIEDGVVAGIVIASGLPPMTAELVQLCITVALGVVCAFAITGHFRARALLQS